MVKGTFPLHEFLNGGYARIFYGTAKTSICQLKELL
jgi:hypothetical protein